MAPHIAAHERLDADEPRPGFQPAWWLRGAHAQTLYAAFCPRRWRDAAIGRERWELDDGDFLDVRVAGQGAGPIVLLLHGLEGSANSPYVRGMMRAIVRRGWRAMLIHFRGCGGESNRLPAGYHSGHTDDLEYVVNRLKRREPGTPLGAVGFSLGGNVLLKWLAERGEAGALSAAVAVSVPYDLGAAADRIERGCSRLYQWHLLRSLRRTVRRKLQDHPDALELTARQLRRLRTFRAFDDRVTAPLHGFAGAADYYARCSSGPMLGRIATPTLLVHARNDPFMDETAIPRTADLPGCVRLEVSDDGGHVGFVGGKWPWRPVYWLEHRVPAFLGEWL